LLSELPFGFLDEVERLTAEGRHEEATIRVYRTMLGRTAEEV